MTTSTPFAPEQREGPASPEESTDVRDYLRPIWRYRWLILLIVIVATTAVYAKQSSEPKRFEASTRVFVGAANASQLLTGQVPTTGDRNVSNQAALVRTKVTAQAAARAIGYRGDPDALLESVTATPDSKTDFIVVGAAGPTGDAAAKTANAFAEAFIQITGESNRQKALEARALAQRQLRGLPRGDAFITQRQNLQAQIGQLTAAISTPTGDAEVVDPAQAPTSPVAPRPTRDAVFAFVLALVAGIGLAFALARADRRIRRLEDVPSAYRLPMLASIPHSTELTPLKQGENVILGTLKETFRGLRSNLLLASLGTEVEVLVVVSAVPSEGKSSTTRNLALAYHEAGASVCIVDADLRRPTQRLLFHRPDAQRGLTDVLVGELSLDEALIDIPVADVALRSVKAGPQSAPGASATSARFSLLHAGIEPANPQAVLASDSTTELIAALRERFDHIIIDTPPLLVVSDAVPLVMHADGVVVVGRINRTTRDNASKVVELLGRTRAKVLGVVGNDVSGYGQQAGQYAYYGYGYGTDAQGVETDKPKRAKGGRGKTPSSPSVGS